MILKRLVTACLKQFVTDGCLTSAAALSFTTLLGLVPLLAVSFYWIKIFFTEPAHQQKILEFIMTILPPEYGVRLFQELVTLAMNATKLNMPGLLSLIVIIIAGLNTIDHTLNRIWNIKRCHRSLYKMMLYFLVLLSVPVLIGYSIYLTSYLTALPLVSEVSNQLGLVVILRYIGPTLISFIGFTILFMWVPNTNVIFRYAIAASIITTLLFELTKLIILTYIKVVPTYNIIYGALASIPIFCVWMYLSWSIVLFGAVINFQLQDKVFLNTEEGDNHDV